MDQAASQVVRASIERSKFEPGPSATVNVSAQARALASDAGDSNADIAGALIDQNVAKHLNAANVKVLQTTDETVEELIRRR